MEINLRKNQCENAKSLAKTTLRLLKKTDVYEGTYESKINFVQNFFKVIATSGFIFLLMKTSF